MRAEVKMGEFGDRMKLYETREAGRKFLPLLPICVRIDGKNFSRFTKSLNKPYDQRLIHLMRDTTRFLVKETQASTGYTHSDEINLVWYSDNINSQIFFDGRIQKMISVLASLATARFNLNLAEYIPEKAGQIATFDARAWQVPNLEEAANVFLWRELDAIKNSISSLARCHFSHKQMYKKNSKEALSMLNNISVIWEEHPSFFTRGSYVQKHKEIRKYTAEELGNLPSKHEARNNPDLVIERTDIRFLDMPKFLDVRNRFSVIFEGADPIVDLEGD